MSKPDITETLKEGGRSSTGGEGCGRLRDVLVVAEMALALVLLIGAGLLIQSFWRLENVSPGFNPHRVLTMELSPPQSKYPSGRSVVVFYGQVLERIKGLAGVKSTGLVNILPLSGSNTDDFFFIEGRMPRTGTPR
jgi:putative ABC transport system permease protein